MPYQKFTKQEENFIENCVYRYCLWLYQNNDTAPLLKENFEEIKVVAEALDKGLYAGVESFMPKIIFAVKTVMDKVSSYQNDFNYPIKVSVFKKNGLHTDGITTLEEYNKQVEMQKAKASERLHIIEQKQKQVFTIDELKDKVKEVLNELNIKK